MTPSLQRGTLYHQAIPWRDESVIVAWEDYRSNLQYEIYLQKINDAGRTVWEENGSKIQSKNGGRSPQLLASAYGGSFYVFWEDYTGGGKAIYGQKYLAD